MRVCLVWAAVHGFVAVAIGAFAAHGFEGTLGEARLGWIETGARYQMAHALALLALAGLAGAAWPGRGRGLGLVAWAFALGALLFSGGLYLAAIFDWTWLMPVVPVGGTVLLLGWGTLAVLAVAARPGTS